MSEPGTVEIDRSSGEPLISIGHPPGPYTVAQLRLYAEYLATVADEAERPPPEPEVEELVAVFQGTPARFMVYEDGIRELARAAVAAGWKREITPREEGATR